MTVFIGFVIIALDSRDSRAPKPADLNFTTSNDDEAIVRRHVNQEGQR
jgi:hypothetical protein